MSEEEDEPVDVANPEGSDEEDASPGPKVDDPEVDQEASVDDDQDATVDPFEELASRIDREAVLGTEAGGEGFDEDAFSVGSGASGSDATSPFDELDPDVDDVDDVDLDELFEEAFTEGQTEALGEGGVWEQLEGDDVDSGETGIDEHVVSAREFCAQCEHAAEPPEVHCTYEGSEIVEFVDKDTVRVRNCPIVAQRRRVGRME